MARLLWYPSPLWISGIMGSEGNREVIYGLQSVAGKVLSRKELSSSFPARVNTDYCESEILSQGQMNIIWLWKNAALIHLSLAHFYTFNSGKVWHFCWPTAQTGLDRT
jgi:hypothetical protein